MTSDLRLAFSFAIGSDTSNYENFYILKASLVVGWNLIKMDLDNPTAPKGDTDWSAIAWLRIRIDEVASNTHDFTVYVDSIMLVRPFLKGFSLLPIFRTRRR